MEDLRPACHNSSILSFRMTLLLQLELPYTEHSIVLDFFFAAWLVFIEYLHFALIYITGDIKYLSLLNCILQTGSKVSMLASWFSNFLNRINIFHGKAEWLEYNNNKSRLTKKILTIPSPRLSIHCLQSCCLDILMFVGFWFFFFNQNRIYLHLLSAHVTTLEFNSWLRNYFSKPHTALCDIYRKYILNF